MAINPPIKLNPPNPKERKLLAAAFFTSIPGKVMEVPVELIIGIAAR